MIKQYNGFSLIEFLVATAIASVLASFLFTIVKQTNDSTSVVERLISLEDKAMLLQRQLERDLSGSSVPFIVLEQREENKKTQEKKSTNPQPTTAQSEEKKKKKTPELDKIFYASIKDKQLNLLTCITNNPLLSPTWLTGDKPTPRLVRVVYRLKAQPPSRGKTNLYTLYRQESANLVFEDFKEGGVIREYELISDVSQISCSFISIENEGKDDKTVVTSDDWDREELLKNKTKKEKAGQNNKEEEKPVRPIPYAVEITATLSDENGLQSRSYTFYIPIIPDFMMIVPRAAEQQPAKTPPAPGAPAKAGEMPAGPNTKLPFGKKPGSDVPQTLRPLGGKTPFG